MARPFSRYPTSMASVRVVFPESTWASSPAHSRRVLLPPLRSSILSDGLRHSRPAVFLFPRVILHAAWFAKGRFWNLQTCAPLPGSHFPLSALPQKNGTEQPAVHAFGDAPAAMRRFAAVFLCRRPDFHVEGLQPVW